MSKTYFVSDLHLFSPRSRTERFERSLRAAADQAGQVIFGGDIFDFRWSTVGDAAVTSQAAEQWLDAFVSARPACRFDYVVGNHDCHREMIERLQQLQSRHANFQYHAEWYRQGGDVFLHGDVLDGWPTPEALQRKRARWARQRRLGPGPSLVYDLIVAARLHRHLAALWHRPHASARRLLQYLRHAGHTPENGLRRVYFGHTHLAVSDVRCDDVAFFNGGAPLSGLEFQILEVHSPDD